MQFLYKNNSGTSKLSISSAIEKLTPYIEICKGTAQNKDYTKNEASLCLVSDEEMQKQVNALIEKKKINNLKYIITVGIGGSNLGTKAIYDAIYGQVDHLQPERYPKILFLDTTNPEFIFHFAQFFEALSLREDEVIVNIISKSGTNTEPAVNGEIVIEILKKKFNDWKKTCVVTTDKNSPLWNSAVELGIDVLEIPKNVGGRYSVFSAVGLFPLALCGVDIKNLLSSASKMRDLCLQKNEHNNALISAAILYEQLTNKGVVINDNFYFNSELESLGKWYRQLMGESTGKNGIGLTPTISIGSADLHSVVQLYLGGPKNKYTSFVYSSKDREYKLPSTNTLACIKEIEGKSVGDVMDAIRNGTTTAYKKLNLPYTETIFEGISAGEIGAYMQFKMMEIMYLSQLMRVNAFDQPQVELYKIETKKILAKK